MTNSPDERGAELRELFFETSQELLQALNDEALKLEKQPGDEEIVRSIRRTVHTLKGDSAACGLRELSELSHQFEDALSLEAASSNAAVAEIAFASADVFAEMISAYRSGGKLPSTKSLSKKIQDLMAVPVTGKKRGRKAGSNKAAAKGATSSVADWTEYEKLAMIKAQAGGQDVVHVLVKIDPHCAMPIAGRQLIHNAVSTMGPVVAVRPDPKAPAATKQVEFVLATVQSAEQIAAKCKIPTIVEEVTVEMMMVASQAAAPTVAPAASPVASPGPAAAIEPAAAELTPESEAQEGEFADAATPHPELAAPVMMENILRVEAGRIDTVLNLMGELIIGKSMLQQTLNEFGKRFPKDILRGKFADAMAFQARVLNDLQRSVM